MYLTLSSGPSLECDYSDFLFGRNTCWHSEYDSQKGYYIQSGHKQYDINLGEIPSRKEITKQDIENLKFPWEPYKDKAIEHAGKCAGISLVGDIFGYNWVQIAYTGGSELFMTSEKWKEIPYKVISNEEYFKVSNFNET